MGTRYFIIEDSEGFLPSVVSIHRTHTQVKAEMERIAGIYSDPNLGGHANGVDLSPLRTHLRITQKDDVRIFHVQHLSDPNL